MIADALATARGKPVFVLLAGPNGSGKSTFREKRLIQLGLSCIDPDEVALDMYGHQALSPTEARATTIEASEQIRTHFSRQESVCLETVFSDTKGHKKALIEEACASGYYTIMFFIGVDSPEVSIARVAQRVADGGHDIPDELITERFPRAFANAKSMLPIVDIALLFDNTGCYGETRQPIRHIHIATIAGGRLSHLQKPLPAWFVQHGFDVALGV
jgi:predicted ABC-type ATPase